MLFIFDWDGTLMDSTDKIIRCMQAAIKQLDLPQKDDEQVRHIIGLGLPEAVRRLFPGEGGAILDELAAGYSRHFIEADQTPCHFYPDVERVLIDLRTNGHQLAVATGKSRRGLDRVLANLKLSHFFDASRCADETASKPHPLMLEQLLDQCGMTAESAVMIGDTEFDLEMATNAGMRSIGVSYGAHVEARLLKHEPEMIIDSFTELLDWNGL